MKRLDRAILVTLAAGAWALAGVIAVSPQNANAVYVHASEVEGLDWTIRTVVEEALLNCQVYVHSISGEVYVHSISGEVYTYSEEYGSIESGTGYGNIESGTGYGTLNC